MAGSVGGLCAWLLVELKMITTEPIIGRRPLKGWSKRLPTATFNRYGQGKHVDHRLAWKVLAARLLQEAQDRKLVVR